MDASGQEEGIEESTVAPTEEPTEVTEEPTEVTQEPTEVTQEPTEVIPDTDESTTPESVNNDGEDYDYMWPTRPPMRPRPLLPWRRQ